MQGATLVDERPLTPEDVVRRQALGAPSFATNPARLFGLPRGVSSFGALPLLQDDGTFYTTAQMALVTWCQGYPQACDPRDFGSEDGDFSGTANGRTERALKSFQQWAKDNGVSGIRTDGVLDSSTLFLLQKVSGDVAARHLAPQQSSSSGPSGWAIAVGLGVLALVLFGPNM